MFMTLFGVILFIFILICLWSVFEIFLEKRESNKSNYRTNPASQGTDES